MKSIRKVLAFAGTRPELFRESKRAWAEYFEMERTIVRQRLYLRLYHTLVIGFLVALMIDKLAR
jgi:hypothetical protein